uniref:Peptidase M12A domain-containing protein n=1 Tax=Angiostrongylus cantonensis TaxID=6313 RepID=A0A0K0DCC6_ANGCA
MEITSLLAAATVVTRSDAIRTNDYLKSMFSLRQDGGRDGGKTIRDKIPYHKDVKSDTRAKRQVLKESRHRNPIQKNGVFYTFNTSDLIVQKVFKMNAKVWSDDICIDFVESKNGSS